MKTILERLKTEKNLTVYTKEEGKLRLVKNIQIFDQLLPPGYYDKFDPTNQFHVENSKLPDMVICGIVGDRKWWWDKDGNYYDIVDTPGITLSRHMIPVPEKKLQIL